jgi:hypothetical protein
MHAWPVIKATPAGFDEGKESLGFPVVQGATADRQPRQQLLFVKEARLVAHTLPRHIRAGCRHPGAIHNIIPLTVTNLFSDSFGSDVNPMRAFTGVSEARVLRCASHT